MEAVVAQLPLSIRTFTFPPPHPPLSLAYKDCYILRSGTQPHDYTGLRIWPGAHLLLRFLLHSHPHLHRLSVCELGSGIGVCGLACASFASRVILTDRVPAVLELLQHNVRMNQLAPHTAVVHPLDWGCAGALALLAALLPPPIIHCVIAADVIYPDTSTAVMHRLLDTVVTLLQGSALPTPTSSPFQRTFVLSYVQRSASTSRRFFDAVNERGMQCTHVDSSSFVESERGHVPEGERSLDEEMQGLKGFVLIIRMGGGGEWRSTEPFTALCELQKEDEAQYHGAVTTAEEDEAAALPLSYEV